MPHESANTAEREERLSVALAECVEAVEAVPICDRTALLARYPEFARELAEFFRHRDLFNQVAAPLRESIEPVAALFPRVHADKPRVAPYDGNPLPRFFGDYELLEEIGLGGMGVVYRARHKRLGRLVALKTIRSGALASQDDLRRFRNEVEAVAALDHAGIVPVYAVGEHDGQQYFSMKLLEGGSLDQHVARYARDPKAAARLVAAVARAVHHAHQRGILHRDLKPSNILLDAEGAPHVTDFGLAKRVEVDSSLTQTGAIIGTPSYMAPEQASGIRGAVTIASDVYGLGALLYTLLCGRPPFKGDNVLDTLEQIRTREPESPSGSNPRVDRDLQTVCLKCLEKEPARRYPSALAVAEDLDRWLAGEPIEARAVGKSTRVWRWCRRNPLVASLITAVVLMVVVAIAGLSVATAVIWRQQGKTAAALIEARENHARAETNRARAEGNTQQANWAIERILCALDPQRSPRPVTVDELREWQTGRALAFFAMFCKDESEDPSIRLQRAAAYVHTGRVYQVLGQHEKARNAFLQAIAINARLIEEFPDEEDYLYSAGMALRILALDRYEVGQRAEANRYCREAMAVWFGSVQKAPTRLQHRVQLAQVLCNWFDPHLRNPAAALDLARQAVAIAPDYPEARIALGMACYRNGRWHEALEALQQASQSPFVDTCDQTMLSLFLAMTLWQLDRHGEALRAYKDVQERMEHSFRAAGDVTDRAIRDEAAALLGIKFSPDK
jgi:tetratricopeptide (TPR) repeat protein